ncbi:hypothetical protein HRR78_007619 [Exophiala dermatitidis]|nr:hypothetical protein HRR75_007247 [Exophiala dermatitidis]KAJ4541272.1 hypothetical protein HRR78_007619 [Exophiala dermatitidis]
MGVTTRSATSSPVKKSVKETSAAESKSHREPLKHFILPKDISEGARFLLLSHPRDSSKQRFLFCPSTGLFQFTKVQTPSTDPRSLLFTRRAFDANDGPADTVTGLVESDRPLSNGYISKSAEFFVATPFDMVFIFLPLLMPAKAPSSKVLFQPLDDILEHHLQNDTHLRASEEKVLRMVMQKIDNAVDQGLPASLEEKFVARALEAPVLSVKREDTAMSTVSANTEVLAPDMLESPSESFESQSTATSSAQSVFSEASTASSVSTVVQDTVPQELCDLQKRRTVLEFILSSYFPASFADRIRARLNGENSPINFVPLEEHLKSIADMRAKALASRSVDDFSRKRGLDDDEALDLRAEKKRKQEEEDKKKKLSESRGVRELKKVNVSGMKKMSDFFAKKSVAKAKA